MPEPVSPPLPTRTSIETTLGRIRAATAAVDPAGRRSSGLLAGTAPMSTVRGRWLVAPCVRATSPPMPPPRTAAVMTAMARTDHPGGESRQSLIGPLWPVVRLAATTGGRHQRGRRRHNDTTGTRLHRSV